MNNAESAKTKVGLERSMSTASALTAVTVLPAAVGESTGTWTLAIYKNKVGNHAGQSVVVGVEELRSMS
jgi:hypothetical protein